MVRVNFSHHLRNIWTRKTNCNWIYNRISWLWYNKYNDIKKYNDDLLRRISIIRDKDTNKIRVEYIETKLLNAIKQNNESKKSIIVIHNLNNASNAVLDKLSSIFDKEQKYYQIEPEKKKEILILFQFLIQKYC